MAGSLIYAAEFYQLVGLRDRLNSEIAGYDVADSNSPHLSRMIELTAKGLLPN
jgi:hypothetical protein